MKNQLKKVVIGLMFVLSLTDIAQAEDRIALTITCTIPVIPGVNAPAIESKQPKQENNSIASSEVPTKQNEQVMNNPTDVIQEEAQTMVKLANGNTAAASLQTIYYR